MALRNNDMSHIPVVPVGVWDWFGMRPEKQRREVAARLKELGVALVICPANGVQRQAGLVYDYKRRGSVVQATDAHFDAWAEYIGAWQDDGFRAGPMLWGWPWKDHMEARERIFDEIESRNSCDLIQDDLEGHWIHNARSASRAYGGFEGLRTSYKRAFIARFGSKFNITSHGGLASMKGTLEPILDDLAAAGGSGSGQFYSTIVPGKEWSRDPFYRAGDLQSRLVPDWERIFGSKNFAGIDTYGPEHPPYDGRYREAMQIQIAASVQSGADMVILWNVKQLLGRGAAARARRDVIREYTGGEMGSWPVGVVNQRAANLLMSVAGGLVVGAAGAWLLDAAGV